MSTIQLRTSIPGPKSKALGERRAKAVPRGLSHGTPIYVAKAEDAWLEDVDGNRYLDFAGRYRLSQRRASPGDCRRCGARPARSFFAHLCAGHAL